MKLTNAKIKTLSIGKKHADGAGLYLLLSKRQQGKWSYRFMLHNKSHEMGLGQFPLVTLIKARQLRDQYRLLKDQGQNPLFDKRKREEEKRREQGVYFFNMVDQFIKYRKPQWTCPKNEKDWRSSLEKYAYPILNKKPLSMITHKDIEKVLDPIWDKKKDLPKKLQERLNLIMGFAKQRGLYHKPNPAAWNDNLKFVYGGMPHPSEIKHHRSLHYTKLPLFFEKLEKYDVMSSLALQFLILTVARTKEVLLCSREEISLERRQWKIPAKRMKARKEHIVPLSDQSLSLIEKLYAMHNYRYLFAGLKPNQPLCDVAMLSMVKKRFKTFDTTVHGFRSTFRDWAAETGDYDYHMVEFALAHRLDSRTEGAYFRSDLREKRKSMMQDWADYTSGLK